MLKYFASFVNDLRGPPVGLVRRTRPTSWEVLF